MNDPLHPAHPAPGLPRATPIPSMPPMARPLTSPQSPSHAQQSPQTLRAPMSQPHLPAHGSPGGLPRQGAGSTINPAAHQPKPAEEDSIALVDDLDEVDSPQPSKIKQLGGDGHVRKHEWKRQPKMSGEGAVRVKTFHAKLSDQGLEYLDDAINVFIDQHPEVDIKFVTTNVGMFDGKFKDIALIVNVWY